MKNYRFLVPIILVISYVLSFYLLYSEKEAIQLEYEGCLNAARSYREQGIVVDAEAQYLLAIEKKPTLNTYLELGDLYIENGLDKKIQELCKTILAAFPEDPKSYEFAIEQYVHNQDYIACFDAADIMSKRNVISEFVHSVIDAIEYQYYLSTNYMNVGVFSGGVCPVQIRDYWGLVNQNGKQVVTARYLSVGPFSGGLAPVVTQQGEAYYIDTLGNKKKVITNVDGILSLGLIENDVFCLQKADGWRFYNSDGQCLFGPFEQSSNIGNGMAAVMNDGKWQLVDYSGTDLTGRTYSGVVMDEKLVVYRNERVFVKVGESYQMIDANGNSYSKHEYEAAKLFGDYTYAAVRIGGLWGFVDKLGELIIEPQYEDARSYSNGFAAVKVGDLWGFINADGEMVIEPRFQETKDFTSTGSVYVRIDDEWRLLVLYKYNH